MKQFVADKISQGEEIVKEKIQHSNPMQAVKNEVEIAKNYASGKNVLKETPSCNFELQFFMI